MSVAALWVLTAPSPSPSPTQGPTELEVTPGLAGFLAIFVVAVACVLLFLSLTRHLRRATRNAQDRGLPVEEPKRIAFGRRHPGQDAGDAAGGGTESDGTPDDGAGGDATGEAGGDDEPRSRG